MTNINHEDAKVTVITALYNNKNFIEQCIKSISNQTYKKYKHLIIDDYSTDGSYELLLKVATNYRNIELFRMSSNVGYQEVLNFGIKKSTSEYIAILDSDDIAINNWLEIVINCFNLNNVGVVGGGVILMDEEGISANVKRFADITGDVTDLIRQGAYPIAHSGICYKKKYLEQVGLYSTNLKSAEDSDIFLGISYLTRIYSVGIPLIYYRRLISSESRKTLEYSNAIKKYLAKKNSLLLCGYSNVECKQYLKKEILELKDVKRLNKLNKDEYYSDMALIFSEGKNIRRSISYLSKMSKANLSILFCIKLLALYFFPIKIYILLSILYKKLNA